MSPGRRVNPVLREEYTTPFIPTTEPIVPYSKPTLRFVPVRIAGGAPTH